MSNHRLVFLSLFTSLFTSLVACADDPPAPASDGAVVALPIDPTGSYRVTSSFTLAAPPAAATTVLADLSAMTDGPDDPSRYLIDLMIDRLPDGTVKTYATAIAPYVAAYVNQRLAEVAPRFVDGTRALSTGLSRIAQRFGTTETFAIASDGPRIESDDHVAEAKWLARTIVGLRFELHDGRDVADVRFAPLGLPDLATSSLVVLDGTTLGGAATHAPDQLSIATHRVALPYRRMLRLGFDVAVIPGVVPGTYDLTQALIALVDCSRLGALVADYVGLGSPSFYTTACTAGLGALATKLYARIDAIEGDAWPLELAGTARAVDSDGDGAMDAISAGMWSGTFASAAATGGFEGARE